MKEFFSAFIDAWKPHWGTVLACAVSISPLFIWAGAIWLHLHREREVAAPQQEKLLRPPGYSSLLRMDDIPEAILQNLLGAALMLMIAVVGAVGSASFFGFNGPHGYTLFFTGLSVIAAVPGVAFMFRAWGKTLELRNLRLGLRGEQAVAEVLHEVGDAGYRAFHDLQPEGTWNIDHVLVGTRGVFLIETKARRRRPPKREQPKHVVVYDGQELIFPCGTDSKAIPQVQRNSEWLASFLLKKTCETVRVETIVVLPGWYTESKGDFPAKVMNTNYLRTYLRKQPERIDPVQVRRMIAALDDQCRTVEF